MSRQVLVQRCLLPPSSVAQPYDLLSLRNLQNGLFEPIERVSSSSGLTTLLSKLGSNSGVSQRQQQQQPEIEDHSSSNNNYNSSDGSGVPITGPDMPDLEFSVEATTLPATSTTLPEDAQDESTSKLSKLYIHLKYGVTCATTSLYGCLPFVPFVTAQIWTLI